MSSSSKGESHRIYWQQWISSKNGSSNSTNGINVERKSRRELITSSAVVRISHTGARAKDVTDLLRSTLKLGNANTEGVVSPYNAADNQDSLVLVGTLYSLPRSYVQFEHELAVGDHHHHHDHERTTENGSSVTVPSTYSTKSDPYHVVKTLQPNDDPLQVRRRMEDHLSRLQQAAPVSRTIISPKLQWLFVPAPNETNSLIPNCVELDGYCTSLEEEESDDDENDEVDDDERYQGGGGSLSPPFEDDDTMLRSRFPWLFEGDSSSSLTGQIPADVDQRVQCESLKDRIKREDRLIQQLSKQKAITLKSQCLSGYLWKRSRKDPQVWRKSHCILTDDYLWSVSRIYEHGEERFSKHSCIRLTRALLLEPSSDYIPLYRIPYAFEVVTGKGISHVFRASNKALQTRWIQALSNRIVQSFENSLIDHAELIVADECLARNRRLAQHVVEPFWEAVSQQQEILEADDCAEKYFAHSRIDTQEHIGLVLRWGIQVAAYRETCRHIQSLLPAKSPVVASSSSPRRPSDPAVSNSVQPEPIDPAVQCMIQSAWTRAAELLTRATHVASKIQPKLSRSVETQCRHVDYIIHGRFRSNGGDGAVGEHHDVPPVDLLDPLVSELQSLAARVTYELPTTQQPSSNGETEH